MIQAGWYPDPAGTPQTYRYWDGTRWSQQTTTDPYAPPPAPTGAPPPPAPASRPVASQYAPQQPLGGGYPPAPAPRRTGLVVLLVVVTVLALAGLSVGGLLSYGALTDDGEPRRAGPTAGTETTAPTEHTSPTEATTPTDTGSAGVETTEQQCRGGRPDPAAEPPGGAEQISGGGLSIPVPEGYLPDVRYSEQFTFADGFTPAQKVIEQAERSGWVSIYGVGALNRGNGFTDPAQAAEVVMSCMAQSPSLYNGFTGREDLSAGEITIDGSEAYQVTAELRVDDPALSVEGDVAQVVVVDTGDPETFGLYLTVVPIGDAALIAQQEAAVARIRVD